MERQEATSVELIHPGHLRRYEFARSRVSGRVLDAACGVGYGSKILHDAGCEVTGVDIEPSAIKIANKHYSGPTYICGDIMDAPWSGFYEWGVSFETVEHICYPLEFLKRMRASCGNLILSTPNEEVYPFNPEKFKGDSYPHLRHYTPKELDHLVADAGFEVLERFCQPQKVSDVTPGTKGFFMVYVCR